MITRVFAVLGLDMDPFSGEDIKDQYSLGFADIWAHLYTKEASFQRRVFWNISAKPAALVEQKTL